MREATGSRDVARTRDVSRPGYVTGAAATPSVPSPQRGSTDFAPPHPAKRGSHPAVESRRKKDARERNAGGLSLDAVELDNHSLFSRRTSLVRRLLAWRQTRAGRLAWYAAEVGVVTGLYYLAARAGLRLAYLHGSVTALWPPVGVGIAALVIGGPGLWPGIVAGDLLVADFSTPWGTVLGQTLGNTLEVVVAALLFIRLAEPSDLERVWDVLALVICAVVGTVISAAFGVVSLRSARSSQPRSSAACFGPGGVRLLGRNCLCASPPRLVGASIMADISPKACGGRALTRHSHRPGRGALATSCSIHRLSHPHLGRASLRPYRRRKHGRNRVRADRMEHRTGLRAVRSRIHHAHTPRDQLFVAVAALTSLVLAAVTAERWASEETQRELTAEQASLRRIATLVASEAASASVFEQVTVEAARTLGASAASLARFDPDNTVTFIGAWSRSGALAFPVGSSLSLDGASVLASGS